MAVQSLEQEPEDPPLVAGSRCEIARLDEFCGSLQRHQDFAQRGGPERPHVASWNHRRIAQKRSDPFGVQPTRFEQELRKIDDIDENVSCFEVLDTRESG